MTLNGIYYVSEKMRDKNTLEVKIVHKRNRAAFRTLLNNTIPDEIILSCKYLFTYAYAKLKSY